MRNIKVVDYTFGRKSSDDVDTSLPFTENFKEAKTIQQANVVIGAYVNQNIKDTQAKQDTLVSGENIKTINNESILGSGNINIQAESVAWGDITGDIEDQADLQNVLDDKQDTLISGTNIKTINNESILGTGNISIQAGASAWGDITGDIEDQADLQEALDSKIPGNEIISSGSVIGYEITDDLYMGNYGNIKEVAGRSQFYNCPTVQALEPTANNQLANKGYVDGAIPSIVDNLTSTSSTSVLSAKQGKILNDKINGVSLFEDDNGTNGTVILSDNTTKYSKLLIQFKTIDDFYSSVLISVPYGKKVTLMGIYGKVNEMAVFFKSRTVEIGNTTISTYDNQYQETVIATTGVTMGNNNHIYITKVIGFIL